MNLPSFFNFLLDRSAGNKQPVSDSPQALDTTASSQETQQLFEGESSLTCREQILHACSTNDISSLHTLFQSLNIFSSHPEITYPPDLQPQPSDPPWTCEMLMAAVREQHDPMVEYLLTVFPHAQIGAGIIEAALSHRSIPIWTRLLAHDRSFLNIKIDKSQSTPFSHACWGSEPDLPLLMLEYGADPNIGGFMRLSNLTIAMQKQPVELIQQFVHKGAELKGELINAVRHNRVDVVRCLLDNGVAPAEIHGSVMAAAKERGNKKIIEILKSRA